MELCVQLLFAFTHLNQPSLDLIQCFCPRQLVLALEYFDSTLNLLLDFSVPNEVRVSLTDYDLLLRTGLPSFWRHLLVYYLGHWPI